MGYLNETTGVIGGLLPAPHDSVRIEIGPAESNHIYITYEGTHEALVAAGALDALMASTLDSAASGRDVKLRPYTKQRMLSGIIRIKRTVASIKNATDLPGIRGSAMQVASSRPRGGHLRLV